MWYPSSSSVSSLDMWDKPVSVCVMVVCSFWHFILWLLLTQFCCCAISNSGLLQAVLMSPSVHGRSTGAQCWAIGRLTVSSSRHRLFPQSCTNLLPTSSVWVFVHVCLVLSAFCSSCLYFELVSPLWLMILKSPLKQPDILLKMFVTYEKV